MSLYHLVKRHKQVDLSGFVPVFVETEQVGWTPSAFAARISSFSDTWLIKDDTLVLNPSLKDFDSRTEAINDVFLDMAEQELIEPSPPYPSIDWLPVGRDPYNALFKMQRFYARKLGVMIHSVVVNAYDSQRMWLSIRGQGVDFAAGKYDNLVAGAMTIGQKPADAVAFEGIEEAGITPEYLPLVHPTGIVPLYYLTQKGYLANEILYLYDFNTQGQFTPSTHLEWEVAGFEAFSFADVLSLLEAADKVKSEANLTLIDFLVRHGHITPEYPDYIDTVSLLKSSFPGTPSI